MLQTDNCTASSCTLYVSVCMSDFVCVLWLREEYYGLRVRQERDPAQAINLPVSTTVGPSGQPLLQPGHLSVPHPVACFLPLASC